MPEWRLIRTKSGKERMVEEQLSLSLSDVLLPLLRTTVCRWGKPANTVTPLFPCYLFARFDFGTEYNRVRYRSGVRELVRAGNEPVVVPEDVIAKLKQRCAAGPLELPAVTFRIGDRVQIVEGPLRGFEAVFERYLSGAERVALLMSSLETFAPRVVLPTEVVKRLNEPQDHFGTVNW